MIKRKTRNIKVRLTEEEYDEYLSLFKNAKLERNNRRYSASDYIRDCIFRNRELKVKVVRVEQPSKCQKQRLQMLISVVRSFNSIAISLIILTKRNNLNLSELDKNILLLDELSRVLKGQLC